MAFVVVSFLSGSRQTTIRLVRCSSLQHRSTRAGDAAGGIPPRSQGKRRNDEASSSDPRNKLRSLNFRLISAGKQRKLTGVLRVWEELKEVERLSGGSIHRNAYSFNAFIDALIKCNKHDLAEDALAEMERLGITPDTITYNTLLKSCFAGGPEDLERAENLVKKLESSANARPDRVTFNSLLNCYCSAAEVGKAEEIYLHLQNNFEIDSFAASTLVAAYGRRGDRDQVTFALWEQLERDRRILKRTLAPAFYNAACDAYLRCGDVNNALALLQKIYPNADYPDNSNAEPGLNSILSDYANVLCRVRPNVRTTNTLLKAYRDAGVHFAAAVAVVSRMNRDGHSADVVTYSTLVDIISRHGALDEASRLVDAMLDEGKANVLPRTEIFNSLLRGYFINKKGLDCAFATFERMIELHEVRNLKCRPDAVTITTLIDYCAAQNEAGKALALVKSLERTEWGTRILRDHIAVYNALLKCYRAAMMRDSRENSDETNWLGKARLLIKTLENERERRPRPDLVTFNTLLDIAVMNRSFDAANSIYDEMNRRGLGPDTQTFNILIKGCAKARLGMVQAFEWLQEMKDRGISPDEYTFQAMVAVSARSGDAPRALAFFRETELIKQEDIRRRHQSQQEWKLPHPTAYISLMRAYASFAGDEGLETVLRLRDEMLGELARRGLRRGPSRLTRSEAQNMDVGVTGYATIANAHAERGRLQDVLEVIADMERMDIAFSDTVKFGLIVKGYCKARDTMGAIDFVERNTNKADIVTYNTIIYECIRQNELDPLVRILRIMDKAGIQADRVTNQALAGIMQHAAARLKGLDRSLVSRLLLLAQASQLSAEAFEGDVQESF